MRNFILLSKYASLLCLLIASLSAAADEKEQLTQVASPDKFSFSGYANITVDAPSSNKITLNADDLSLFASGHLNQILNPFAEAEIGGITLLQQGGDPLSGGAPNFILERLYNDSYLSNKLSLRIGKMLSPVGEWNLIHAAPLVMTTTRPMVTYHGFSEYSSGASLIYSDAKGVLPDIQIYVQPGNEIRPRSPNTVVREYVHVAGFHLNWPLILNDKLGISLQHSQIKNTDERQTLLGFNLNKEFGPIEIEMETIHTHISGVNPLRVRDNEWGSYLQGSYSLGERLNLIGRYEYFAARTYLTASENSLLGISYKSATRSVWKLEYVEQHGQQLNIHTGFYGSFSKLF
jgi:hypothetical protein